MANIVKPNRKWPLSLSGPNQGSLNNIIRRLPVKPSAWQDTPQGGRLNTLARVSRKRVAERQAAKKARKIKVSENRRRAERTKSAVAALKARSKYSKQ